MKRWLYPVVLCFFTLSLARADKTSSTPKAEPSGKIAPKPTPTFDPDPPPSEEMIDHLDSIPSKSLERLRLEESYANKIAELKKSNKWNEKMEKKWMMFQDEQEIKFMQSEEMSSQSFPKIKNFTSREKYLQSIEEHRKDSKTKISEMENKYRIEADKILSGK